MVIVVSSDSEASGFTTEQNVLGSHSSQSSIESKRAIISCWMMALFRSLIFGYIIRPVLGYKHQANNGHTKDQQRKQVLLPSHAVRVEDV